MLGTYWLALAAFAAALTLLYVVYHKHVYLTAGLATVSWTVLFLTGGQLEKVTETGTRVSTPVPALQLVAAAAALVSALVLLLYPEHYPVDLDGEVPES